MHVTVRRADLQEAVSAAREVAVDCFHLHGTQGAFSLAALSPEQFLRITLAAVSVPGVPSGRCAVDAGRFQAAVRELAEDEATLTVEKGSLTLSALRTRFQFPALASSPSPPAPLLPGEGMTVSSESLRDALSRVACCASEKPERFSFHGVQFSPRQDGVRLAATDGHHIAVADLPATGFLPACPHMVPARACDLAARALRKDPSSAAEMYFHGANFAVRTSRFSLSARLLCGSLPTYDQLLAAATHSARVSLRSFLGVLRRAAVVIDAGKDSSTSRGVSLCFTEGILSASAQGHGTSLCRAPAEYSGPEVTLTVKPEYPLEALSRLPADADVLLSFTDGDRPLAVRMFGEEGYVYLIMPMQCERPPAQPVDPRGVYASNY